MQIRQVVYEILADKDFTVTDDLISWLFVVTFVHSTYCYDLKSLEWDSKTTLVLSNTRELDRVPKIK